jgi:hypothetical protein
MGIVKGTSPPSVAQRIWGWIALCPWRLALFADPTIGIPDDEDVFSAGEGGDWVWYPAAGSMRPQPLTRWWRMAGSGAGIVGSVTRKGDRIRFVPANYWRRRGLHDWQRQVNHDQRIGPWLVLSCQRATWSCANAATTEVVDQHRLHSRGRVASDSVTHERAPSQSSPETRLTHESAAGWISRPAQQDAPHQYILSQLHPEPSQRLRVHLRLRA